MAKTQEEIPMSKAVEGLLRFWPVLVCTIGLIISGAVLAADVKADRGLFLEKLSSQDARITKAEAVDAKLTILLTEVVPDWREKLARYDERIKALERVIQGKLHEGLPAPFNQPPNPVK